MCRNWEAPDNEVQEFRLTERLTFLEFLPVATASLRKSSSSPELSSQAQDPEVSLKLPEQGPHGGIRMNRQESISTTCSVSSMEDLNSPPASKFGSNIAVFKSSSVEGGTTGPGDGCARWSVGSALHSQGGCKPCTWFWRPGGCTRGEACHHCHQCPRGALQKQKRKNRMILKAKREAMALN
eukprot:Skav214157  [mRNA]  locus=scaffold945:90095:90640:- [translate_table: standard]